MSRYFLAIPLPDDVKDRLAAIVLPSMPDVRRIGGSEMHLTLHFLGDVAPRDIEAASQALQSIQVAALTLEIYGVGRFPPTGSATVLWAGVNGSTQLSDLYQKTGVALSDAIGFRPEARPYTPHITIARLKPTIQRNLVENYLDQNHNLQIPPFKVHEFALYSSTRVAGVPHYSQARIFQLQQTSH